MSLDLMEEVRYFMRLYKQISGVEQRMEVRSGLGVTTRNGRLAFTLD